MLFCIVILSGLLGAIVASPTPFDDMSAEEKQHFFGTSDDVIPEFKLVRLRPPSRMARSTDGSFTMYMEFNGLLISTNLVLVDDKILMGRSTAIWIATSNPDAFNNIFYQPDPTVLERIGDVSFYQDVVGGSALTYYHAGGNFTGIICQYYGVKALPERYKKMEIVRPWLNHALMMRSSGSEKDTAQESGESVVHVIYKIAEVPQEKFISRLNRNTPVNFEPTQNRKRRQDIETVESQEPPEVVYPKLLVSLDYNALVGFSDTVEIVWYLMAFWNCVDMMYRKLSNPAVRLNIVGFIIAADESATPYAIPYSNDTGLDVDTVIMKISLDFYAENQRFDPDSYDIVMAMTRTQLWQMQWKDNITNGTWVRVDGGGRMSSACIKEQTYTQNITGIGGVGITMFDSWFGGVSVVSHELGHIFGVNHDGEGTILPCNLLESKIMAPMLIESLQWSDCSTQAFRDYFGSANASCLRNPPPEEIPPVFQNSIGSWLSIEGTCQNGFGNSEGACYVDDNDDICYRFGCMINDTCVDSTYSAHDGSWCDEGKYCLGSECK